MERDRENETLRLIQRIQARDRGAFESFILEYQRLVFHIIYRMVPRAEDREDLCQDVFMKAYQNLSEFRRESKLSTWIARIAYNTCLNHLHKKKAVSIENRILDQTAGIDWSETDYLPDRQLEDRDLSLRIQDEIAGLPLQYRTAVTLFHLEDMSIEEISKAMALPEGTVKSILFRARKILKNNWTRKYHEEICV